MKKFIFSLLIVISISAQILYARTFADPTIELEGKKTTAGTDSGNGSSAAENTDPTVKTLEGFEFLAMAGYDFGGTIIMKAESGKNSPPELAVNNGISYTMEIPYFVNSRFALGVGGSLIPSRHITGYSDKLIFFTGYGLIRGQYDIPDSDFAAFAQLHIGKTALEWSNDDELLKLSGLYYSANAGVLYDKSLELRFGYSAFNDKSVMIGEYDFNSVDYVFKYSVFTISIGYMF